MARKESFDLKRLEYWLTESEAKYIERHLCKSNQSLQNYVQSLLKAKISQLKAKQKKIPINFD